MKKRSNAPQIRQHVRDKLTSKHLPALRLTIDHMGGPKRRGSLSTRDRNNALDSALD